jgi:hypothetical protein
VVPVTDSAVDILPRRYPLQIGGHVVALVAVHVIDLCAIGAAAVAKQFCDENVDANFPNAAAIMQFDVNIAVCIDRTKDKAPCSGVENFSIARHFVMGKVWNLDKSFFKGFFHTFFLTRPVAPSTKDLLKIRLIKKHRLGDRLSQAFLRSCTAVCILSLSRSGNSVPLGGQSPKGCCTIKRLKRSLAPQAIGNRANPASGIRPS